MLSSLKAELTGQPSRHIPASEVQSSLARGGVGEDREAESGDGLKLDPTDAEKGSALVRTPGDDQGGV